MRKGTCVASSGGRLWSGLLVVATCMPVLALAVVWASGGALNVTSSLPYGVYGAVDAPIAQGQVVVFCPPPSPVLSSAYARGYLLSGRCAGGWIALMKPIVALDGDHVRFADDAVYVNGHALRNSERVERDPAGRVLPRPPVRSLTVAKGEMVVVSSHHPASFDSRYFGPVPRSSIQRQVRPLLTWTARGRARDPLCKGADSASAPPCITCLPVPPCPSSSRRGQP